MENIIKRRNKHRRYEYRYSEKMGHERVLVIFKGVIKEKRTDGIIGANFIKKNSKWEPISFQKTKI